MKHKFKKCVVKSCSVTGKDNDNLKYFSFPKNPELRRKWIEVLQIDDNLKSIDHVCSKHFKQEFILKQRLSPGAIPSLFLKPNFLYYFENGNEEICFKNINSYLPKEEKTNEMETTIFFKTPESSMKDVINNMQSPTVAERLQNSEMPKTKKKYNIIKKDKETVALINFWKKKYSNLRYKYNKRNELNIYLKKELKKMDLNYVIDNSNNAEDAKTLAKMILSDKKLTEKWSEKEMLLASSIMYQSPRIFKYLKDIKCRLPSKNTLLKYMSTKNIITSDQNENPSTKVESNHPDKA